MSTVSPFTARKLAELQAQHGGIYLAAPVFGRPEAAAAQKLWICLAGPHAGKERVRPVLAALGPGFFDYVDDPGGAYIVRLCGNFMIAPAMDALASAAALDAESGLARTAGVDTL